MQRRRQKSPVITREIRDDVLYWSSNSRG